MTNGTNTGIADDRDIPADPRIAELSRSNAALRKEVEQLRNRAAPSAEYNEGRRNDEFLATLAHELRNPLAPIRNGLAILRLGGPDGAGGRVYEMLERQMNHMVRILDDLMEVSRISRGTIELRKENVDLAAVVRSAVETAKPDVEAAHHQFIVSLPDQPIVLNADPVRLSQVLASLLNNAAKFTDAGGRIGLTASRNESEAVVSVRDNGIGIPREMQSKIFDLFTQIDQSSNRRHMGLGIGLTIARSLVESHGGSVECKSEGIGRGSEFNVRLPLAVKPIRSHEVPTPVEASAMPQRIMVVDNNRDGADSLGMLLRARGSDVLVVNDGASALRAFDSFRPSVVLLDIGMPGMDGFAVARQLRQRPGGRDATLIALTGWGQNDDRRQSKEAGFDHHLVKPVEFAALQSLFATPRPGQWTPTETQVIAEP